MLILALDTALARCTAGLVNAEGQCVLAVESVVMERGHAEALMPVIERVVATAGTKLAAVDRIAVTIGPGSFTGLRVGVAAARGLALTLRCPAVGVTTLAALSEDVCESHPGRVVAAAIDARHGHVYFALYGSAGEVLVAPQVLDIETAATHARDHSAIIAGSGAPLLAAAARGDEQSEIVAGDAPTVAAIARLGAATDPAIARPAPLYLRPPDAKPQTRFRIARKCS
ncbi:MAG: tRNA (adenosine(37)-N6)-threonylcarbamoyltransferase complex dimerization subunit type 1 TsaB [Hyphomicrobiales bacterium]|nr:tRNA (adenosine(37)-N6)-threonylcarbamoyltransferase complex dimerization subunit type 1 TsaB [Hyphomicrobiales bacterium]